MKPEISVIIISYNTSDLTVACIRSLLSTVATPVEIILVDNASSDDTLQRVRTEFPFVRVIPNVGNVGFTKANNQGFSAALGGKIWMLNPDTLVLPHAAERLSAALDCADADIVAPKILDAEGRIDNSCRYFPTLGWLASCMLRLPKLFPKSRILNSCALAGGSYDDDRIVDWASGASLMFRRELLDRISGLDEKFFMYCEEVDFCWRANNLGFKTKLICSAEIIHYQGKSSARLRIFTHLQYKWSAFLLLKRHRSTLQATAFAILSCAETVFLAAVFVALGKASTREARKLVWYMPKMFICQTEPKHLFGRQTAA